MNAMLEPSVEMLPMAVRDVDDILGFLHIRDLFDLDPAERTAPISQLVRPIDALPGTVKILRALSYMQANNLHLIIVRDEYGGTAGIVTLEDLVEELNRIVYRHVVASALLEARVR